MLHSGSNKMLFYDPWSIVFTSSKTGLLLKNNKISMLLDHMKTDRDKN